MDIRKLKLPAVSPECSKILEMLGKETTTIARIGKAIALDPMLSACLVRYANSPMYRRPAPVTSVSAAIGVLGMKNVTAAVLMTTMKSFSQKPTPIDDMLWQHAVAISTMAKAVAAKISPAQADTAELAGLLHDVGALILSTNLPREYAELVALARTNNQSLDTLETERFGITRHQLVKHVAEQLRLPADVAAWPESFHIASPTEAQAKPRAILALAHWIETEQVAADQRLPETIPVPRAAALETLGIDEAAANEITQRCQQLLEERFAF